MPRSPSKYMGTSRVGNGPTPREVLRSTVRSSIYPGALHQAWRKPTRKVLVGIILHQSAVPQGSQVST